MLSSRARDDGAFERLYRRHATDVYRYALAVMGSPADAEDVTQTTFLNAYRSFQDGRRPERPLNWLIAIAHNVCRQRFRQSARRPTEVALDAEVAAGSVDESPRSEDLRRALAQLSFKQRSALVLRELEGRSYAEIAHVLGLSKAAVETLIFRARRALREQLESSLSCREAERAISLRLDGALDEHAKSTLRAHLRGCPDCAALARRLCGRRNSLKRLTLLPLPGPLAGLFGGGSTVGAGASAGGGVAVKAAMVGATALIASGAGYEAVHHPAPAVRPHRTLVRHTPRPTVPPRAPRPFVAPVRADSRTSTRSAPSGHGHGQGRALGHPRQAEANGHGHGAHKHAHPPHAGHRAGPRPHGVAAGHGHSHGHGYGRGRVHGHDGRA